MNIYLNYHQLRLLFKFVISNYCHCNTYDKHGISQSIICLRVCEHCRLKDQFFFLLFFFFAREVEEREKKREERYRTLINKGSRCEGYPEDETFVQIQLKTAYARQNDRDTRCAINIIMPIIMAISCFG